MGGGGSGWVGGWRGRVGGGQGGCERRIEIFGKIHKNNRGGRDGGSCRGFGLVCGGGGGGQGGCECNVGVGGDVGNVNQE